MSDQQQEQQKISSASTPGEWLHHERERQGRTVAQIATDLHLSAHMIEAMETNQFSVLGAPVFARGHLRKYATLLGLPVDQIQELYQSLGDRPRDQDPVPVMHRESEPSIPMSPDSKQRRAGRLPVSMTLLIAGVVLAGIVVIAWWFFLGSKHAKLTSTEESGSQLASSTITTDSPAAPVIANGDAANTVSRSSAQQDDSSAKKNITKNRDAGIARGDDTKSVEAKRLGSSAVSPPVNQQASQQVSQQAAQKAVSLARGKVRLHFNFTQESWVEVYDARGTRMLYDVGLPGQTRSAEVDAPAQVVLGLASAVGTEINGRAAIVPARRIASQVARFTVAADGSVQ